MTEAKSAAGLIDHVLRKHEFYSQAECADIPDTIGANLIAVVLSYAAERERLLHSFPSMALHCDLKCEVCGCGYKDWSDEVDRLSSRPATEGNGDD